MARRCIACEKETVAGNNVSHSHRKTRRIWQPNIQRVKIHWQGGVQRAYVCTKCLKAGKVARAV